MRNIFILTVIGFALAAITIAAAALNGQTVGTTPTPSSSKLSWNISAGTRYISFPCAEQIVSSLGTSANCNPLAAGKMVLEGDRAAWADFKICRRAPDTATLHDIEQCVTVAHAFEAHG